MSVLFELYFRFWPLQQCRLPASRWTELNSLEFSERYLRLVSQSMDRRKTKRELYVLTTPFAAMSLGPIKVTSFQVFLKVVRKPARLTGAEIKFIRTTMEQSQDILRGGYLLIRLRNGLAHS